MTIRFQLKWITERKGLAKIFSRVAGPLKGWLSVGRGVEKVEKT